MHVKAKQHREKEITQKDMKFKKISIIIIIVSVSHRMNWVGSLEIGTNIKLW